MDLGAQLGFAWNFALNRERIVLVSLLCVWVLALVLFFVAAVGALASGGSARALVQNPGSALALGVVFVLVFLAFILVLAGLGTWISAGLLKNAASKYSGGRASVRESLNFAKTRFWPLLFASIAVSIFSSIVQQLLGFLAPDNPSAGVAFVAAILVFLLYLALQIIFSLVFFFVSTEVVIGGEGVWSSIRKSVDLFFNRPLEVVVFALLLGGAQIVLFFGFLIPIGVATLVSVVCFFLGGVAGLVLCGVFAVIAVALLILMISFLTVFSEGYLAVAFIDVAAATCAQSAPRPAARKPARKPKRVSRKK